jgi:hypothetical protein
MFWYVVRVKSRHLGPNVDKVWDTYWNGPVADYTE